MKRSKAFWGQFWCVPAIFGLLLGLYGACAGAAGTVAEPDLLDAEKAFSLSARRVGDRSVELRYDIAAGYYMYRDRFRFIIDGQPVTLDKKAWPSGKMKQDATFGKVLTYRNSVRLLLPVSSTSSGSGGQQGLTLTATSQGCADVGVCYPPLRQSLVLAADSTEWVKPGEVVVSGFSRDKSQGSGLPERLTREK